MEDLAEKEIIGIQTGKESNRTVLQAYLCMKNFKACKLLSGFSKISRIQGQNTKINPFHSPPINKQ